MKVKNIFIFGCLLIFFFSDCIAQKPDSVLTIVHYSFINITDTNHRDRLFTQNMVLYLGKDLSVFKSYDKMAQDSIMKSTINESLKTGIIDTRNRKKTINTEIYKSLSGNKMITKQKIVNDYLVEEGLPVMNWTITKEIKQIANIACQKAQGKFKGRVYEAWFTTKYPYNNGPWKLGGLPGLILEANDQKMEVIFNFIGLEVLSKHNTVIDLPKNGTKVTSQQLDKIKEAFRMDPVGFINGNTSTNGITTTVQGPSTSIPANPINNPIELPDKKL